MKKITTLLFIIIAIPLHAQWDLQVSGVTATLVDVHSITDDFVVAIGADGTIIKTIDGGLNWVQKPSGTTSYLNDVQFGSPNIGYILGTNTLLKTIDGGESWTSIEIEGTNNFDVLSCLNEDIFYISDNCVIKKTINGGISFETLPNVNIQGCMREMQFINESIGFFKDDFDLYKTNDGGLTWTIIYNNIFSFFFVNENTGFINSGGELSKTTDGGENYTYLETIFFRMDKIFAPSENIVWGVPKNFYFGDSLRIMRGEILSANEFQMILNNGPLFTSIYFANPTIGYAIAGTNIYKNAAGNLLGINKLNSKETIKIFPNPASTEINIVLNHESAKRFIVKIADSLGKTLYSESYANKDSVLISTASFSKGIYFITIDSVDKKQVKKIVVN